MNKFSKATINTYSKKNPILASKHTRKNLQVSLNFNIARTKAIKNSLMTSTIYGVSYCIKIINSFSNLKEKETKKEQKHKQARNIFLLANNLELYAFNELQKRIKNYLHLHV